jgi:hypothetical protein
MKSSRTHNLDKVSRRKFRAGSTGLATHWRYSVANEPFSTVIALLAV